MSVGEFAPEARQVPVGLHLTRVNRRHGVRLSAKIYQAADTLADLDTYTTRTFELTERGERYYEALQAAEGHR